MKIIDFSPYYPPHIGGLEKYAEELHDNLARKGCQIVVFTPHIPTSAPTEEMRGTIEIIRYPAFDIIFNYPLPCIWKRTFWHQWKKISGNKYDVAISTVRFFVQPLMALFFAKTHHIPLVHIEHCSDYVKNRPTISIISRIVDMTIGRVTLSCADKIIAPSQSAVRFVHTLSGKKASVIYRGMPFAAIDAVPPKNNLREEIKEKKILTFVGRLIYGKGVIHILEAMHLLQRNDIFLLIAGDGPEKEILEEYTRKNGLSKRVRFLGNIPFDQVIGILKVTDIFINPSYNEGLPTSILEAGVCRRAIIATDVGGTTEIITHHQSGIIIRPYDTEAVRSALEKLLDDIPLQEKLGENARLEIERKFNWEVTVSSYLKEMRDLQKIL